MQKTCSRARQQEVKLARGPHAVQVLMPMDVLSEGAESLRVDEACKAEPR
jgi:hypothetical protein